MKTEIAYHKNSDVIKWKRITFSTGHFSCEYTYNEQGQEETFKNSSGHYEIKGKKVTREEFEAENYDRYDDLKYSDIIELNGVKYKRI
jgi:hypothetical protein